MYAYLRSDNTPYYIGKGTGNRAWNKDSKRHRIAKPTEHSRIVIIENNLTEIGAFAIERRLIRWYGRKDNQTGILRNMTDGGEGATGHKHSESTRQKIREKRAKQKIVRTEETKKKIGAANSIALKGKLSPMRGIPKSEETKLKMRKPKGKQKMPQKEVECLHCHKKGRISNMVRWHLDNCKKKQ